MIRISPFCPVCFDYVQSSRDNAKSCYPHLFSDTDNIVLECFCEIGEPIDPLYLINEDSQSSISLSWNTIEMGNSMLLFYEMRELLPGRYLFRIGDELQSNTVIVTDEKALLDNTVLIQFCQHNNRNRLDLVSWIHGRQHYVDFRVPATFLDNDWDFDVDCEQFVTADSDIVELNSIDVTNKRLTVGFGIGVPIWIGEMVNRIMSCDLVYVDGTRYSRVGEAVPEIVGSDWTGNKFVFSQNLRESHLDNIEFELLNRLVLRRTPKHLRKHNVGLRKV